MKILITFKSLTVALMLIATSNALMAQEFDLSLAMVNENETRQLKNSLFKPLMPTEAVSPLNPGINRNAYYAHWQKFLTHFLEYPELAREHFIEGTVKVEINVSAEGDVQSATLVQGLGYGCDEAIVDLVRHMPRWEPRLKNGIPTAQIVIVPISFKLTE